MSLKSKIMEVHFVGLLVNVDSSILNVKLDHGFKIQEMNTKDAFGLLSSEDQDSLYVMQELIDTHYKYEDVSNNSEKLYIVHNTYNTNVGREMYDIPRLQDFIKFNQLIDSYLVPTLKLMRLFKGGDICLAYIFYYYHEGTNKAYMKSIKQEIFPFETFKLDISEIDSLNNFIQTELPFKEEFLEMAFENFNLSYEVSNKNLSFLVLINGLEALFNPGGGELTYRISRNVAVLLGENKKNAEDIQTKMKKLYRIRSKIVHNGGADIKDEELLKLRHYLRESIKEIYQINKSKDDLLNMLNSCGFGHRPWED